MNIQERCCFNSAVQTGVSEREQLYKTLGYYEFQLKLLYNQLLQYGYEQENIDTIKPIIKENEQIVEKYLLLPVEIEEGNYIEAVNLLDDIKSFEDESLSNYTKEQEISLELRTSNKTILETDVQQRQIIENIVAESPILAYNSKALLKHLKGKKYEKKPIIENINSNKSLTFNNNKKNIERETKYDEYFKIYPNPANVTVKFEIIDLENYNNARLVISDIFGRTIKDYIIDKTILIVNSNELQNGIYYAFIVVDKVIVNKKMFTILK